MTPTRSAPRRRVVRRTATAIVVVALAAGSVVGVRSLRPDDEVTTSSAPVLKTATVATGKLTVDETIDGSVVLSATTTVRHRIEGQLASTSATTSTTSGPSSSSPAAANGPITADLTNTLADVPAGPCTPVPATLPTSTVPDTTVPSADPADGSTTTTNPSTTSSTIAADDSSTTSTTTPTCVDQTSTTSVEPSATSVEPSTTVVDPAPGGPTIGGGAPRAGTPIRGTSTASTPTSTTRTTQKVTSTIAAGTSVAPGDVLYTVDGAPVVLLNGLLPAWRTLSADVDDGADVLQLEWSLVALGYDPDGKVHIDEGWDDATTAMVEAWQRGLGQEATGEVALGSVVFLPTAAVISSVSATVGDDVGEGDAILTLAAPTQQVVIDVPDALQASVVPGMVVDLEGTEGTVSLVRTVERSGAVVVQAVIAPSAELTGRINGSTVAVDISITADGAADADVLLVPVEALASRLDGSYAVQVAHGDGTSAWVAVTFVGVDGNTVGIRSDELATGDDVLLPV